MERAEREGIDNVLFRTSPFDDMARLMSLTSLAGGAPRLSDRKTGRRRHPPALRAGTAIYAGWGETPRIVVEKEGVGYALNMRSPPSSPRAVEQRAEDPQRRDQIGPRRDLAERDYSWCVHRVGLDAAAEAGERGADREVPGSSGGAERGSGAGP